MSAACRGRRARGGRHPHSRAAPTPYCARGSVSRSAGHLVAAARLSLLRRSRCAALSRREMARGKVGTILIKMLSTAGTGYFYVKARRVRRRGFGCRVGAGRVFSSRANPNAAACVVSGGSRAQKKNPKKLATKLEFMKYDPRVMKHVLFQETKLK